MTLEKQIAEDYGIVLKEAQSMGCNKINALYNIPLDNMKAIVNALEEVQQYREIGTVEEIKANMEELKRWHTDKTNPKIKNVFANTSTLICHNCDHKDDYIENLEAEIDEYRTIGTVEECRAAVEKQTAAKPLGGKDIEGNEYAICRECSAILSDGEWFAQYCPDCGKKVDWREKEKG